MSDFSRIRFGRLVFTFQLVITAQGCPFSPELLPRLLICHRTFQGYVLLTVNIVEITSKFCENVRFQSVQTKKFLLYHSPVWAGVVLYHTENEYRTEERSTIGWTKRVTGHLCF